MTDAEMERLEALESFLSDMADAADTLTLIAESHAEDLDVLVIAYANQIRARASALRARPQA
jgi:hypothetical protein